MVEPVDRLRELGRLVDRTWQDDPERPERLAAARGRLVGPLEELDALGSRVATAREAIDADTDVLGDVRARLLSAPRKRAGWRDTPLAQRPVLWAGPALALAAALVLFVAWPAAEEPLTYRAAEVEDGARELRFSDGSEVRLAKGAAADVTRMQPQEATVKLRSGRIAVHVVPGGPRRWTFEAGPFAVHVLGTRFRVDWDPGAERFAVDLRRGKVVVVGPVIGRRELAPGDSFTVRVKRREVVRGIPSGRQPPAKPENPAPQRAAKAAAPAPQQEPTADEPNAVRTTVVAQPKRLLRKRQRRRARRRSTAAEAAQVPTEVAQQKAPQAAPPPALAQEERANDEPEAAPEPKPEPAKGLQSPTVLARQGRFADAVRALSEHGEADWLAGAAPADLLLMGDAARFARRGKLALRIYMTLRNRAPGTDQAAAAAFALGRFAVNRHRNHRAAAAWFDRYLKERPHGPLAREACGRLLESLIKVKDHNGACAAAKRYLKRHAAGAHLGLAVETEAHCQKRAPTDGSGAGVK